MLRSTIILRICSLWTKQRLDNFRRHLSSTGSLTTLEVNEKTGVAILSMNRAPVNALNLELVLSLHKSIEDVENNKSRGLILTSTANSIFSAGLDIMEMYKPDQERLRLFWTALQDTWLALYGSSIPTVALINGHSPAGGCLLATSCEYRIMLPGYTIGLNETKMGIIAPKWFVSAFCNVLPRRIAEMALTQGKLFSSEEALAAGLVDEIASNKAAALEMCQDFFNTFAKVYPAARTITKQQFRLKDMQQLQDERKQDLEIFTSFVNQPHVQKSLGAYIEGLKKKSN